MKAIQLLALDIDGVITDGRTRLGARHAERKRIAFQDLDAVNAAKRAGLRVVLVTGEDNGSVDLVAGRFGVVDVWRGAKDKLAALQAVAKKMRLSFEEICYVGDGDRDAPALAQAGLALAPVNATEAAKRAAHRLLERRGGHGAVAEAVQLVLRLREDRQRAPLYLQGLRRALRQTPKAQRRLLNKSLPGLAQVAGELKRAIEAGRKIWMYGNGNCAAMAQAAAGELAGGKRSALKLLPVIFLSSETMAIFPRQVDALVRRGDVLVVFSGGGNPAAILRGLAKARKLGAVTIGFTIRSGGSIPSLVWKAVCEVVQAQVKE